MQFRRAQVGCRKKRRTALLLGPAVWMLMGASAAAWGQSPEPPAKKIPSSDSTADPSPAPPPLPDWLEPRESPEAPPAAQPAPTPAPASPNQPPPAAPLAEEPLPESEREDPPGGDPEVADAFRLSRPFSSRRVGRPEGANFVATGMHFRVAPVRAVAKSQLDKLKSDNPDAGLVLDLAAQVDPDKLADASDEELLELLQSVPGAERLTPEVLASLDLDPLRPLLPSLVEIAQDPEDAVAFALMPYLGMHYEQFAAEIRIPLAGFAGQSDATFELGNITLDLRVNHHFGDDSQFGVTYGTAVGLPTANSRVSALVLTNALDAPLYLDPYLAFEPYAAAGVDLGFFVIQVDFGLSALVATADYAAEGSALYLRYGASLTLSPGSIVALQFEFVGGIPLRTAELFDTHLFTGGLRFEAGPVQLGFAAQLPLAEDTATSRYYGGLPFGSPAEINVLTQFDMSF